ncbi:MAG: trypsin-like peptidase domain-containing protein, partial [Candidatus Contubernalis sp.]|nr:trypsin-like peptidase domain-containing protein [Candidatus Contubernalis sp.]
MGRLTQTGYPNLSGQRIKVCYNLEEKMGRGCIKKLVRVFLISIVVFQIISAKAFSENETGAENKTYEEMLKTTVYIKLWNKENPSRQVQGSGFIADPSGVILTADHLLEEWLPDIEVRFSNGDVYYTNEVKVINVDHRRDIAVIKVRAVNLPCVKLGDSDATAIGEPIYTISSPLGLEGTITKGNISTKRNFGSGFTQLQISAPISHGSSGGPIFNTKGEVVGIITESNTEGQALNFGTPINYAKSMISIVPGWTFTEYVEKRSKEII